MENKITEENKQKICIREINENIRRVFNDEPLTMPLSILNRNCEFKKRYEIAFNLRENVRKCKWCNKEFKSKDCNLFCSDTCEENAPIIKARNKEYRERPEVKARKKEYYGRPEVKERMKEYYGRPEVKERMKEYYGRPEVKERMKEYHARPEVKARKKEYEQRPEVKERRKKNRKEMYEKNKEKIKADYKQSK